MIADRNAALLDARRRLSELAPFDTEFAAWAARVGRLHSDVAMAECLDLIEHTERRVMRRRLWSERPRPTRPARD